MRVLFHCGHFHRNEISFRLMKNHVTLTEIKSFERKHLCMCLFHENKNDWRLLNGQTEFLLWLVKLSFRISFKHPHKEKNLILNDLLLLSFKKVIF